MDGGNEKRVAIKLCFKDGLSATETLVLVQTAYGNEAVNRSKVFRLLSIMKSVSSRVFDFKIFSPKTFGPHCVFCNVWFISKHSMIV